jgi:3-oxoacyl-[acyl-carrier-protein] synthase III
MPGITYIDYYIPQEELPIVDFLEALDVKSIPPSFKDKQEYKMFLENVLGLKSIRIETKLDEAAMIGNLIEKLFATQKIKPEEIDIIMTTTELFQVTRQNIGKLLQFKHHMSHAYAVDITGNHCANMEVAIFLAHSILQSNSTLNNILIVSSNKIEVMEKRIYGAYALVGDAAGIMLVSRNTSEDGKYPVRLREHVILSCGQLHDANVNDDNVLAHCYNYVKCISDLIKKNSLTNDQVEIILIQNANSLMISQCIASAGLNKDKIFSKNLGKYGHMNYVDFMINLKDILDEGIVNRDRYMFTFGIGTTGSYAACLFVFK